MGEVLQVKAKLVGWTQNEQNNFVSHCNMVGNDPWARTQTQEVWSETALYVGTVATRLSAQTVQGFYKSEVCQGQRKRFGINANFVGWAKLLLDNKILQANAKLLGSTRRGRLHDKVFRQKRETFYAFCMFVYTTTAIWGLKTHTFQNGFQSESFLKRHGYRFCVNSQNLNLWKQRRHARA